MRIRLSILAGLLLILSAVTAQAKIWTVDSNQGNSAADFKTAQAAHDSASAGDTLYFSGSSVTYGPLTLTKKLILVGPGYYLSENADMQANVAEAKLQNAVFNDGSDGAIMMGMYVTEGVRIDENNITLKRNRIVKNYSIALEINTYGGNATVSNVIIAQNIIYITYNGASDSYQAIHVDDNCTGIFIINNYINQGYSTADGQYSIASTATNTDLQVINNTIRGKISIGDLGTFNNNILRDGSFTGTKVTPRNNLANGTQFDVAFGNQQNVDMNTVFDSTATSPDGRWRHMTDSPATGAGLNGEDLGMFGGMSPYVLSGIPPIPSIYHFTAPVTGSRASGLPVRIKVRSNK